NAAPADIRDAARRIGELTTTLPLDDHERADLVRVLSISSRHRKRRRSRRGVPERASRSSDVPRRARATL
ncbi:hypothetical protein, partial [Paraburkholderia kirstenboschensis]|uniref:hypothetical protein n=1 Tax=Paraburkholderia kirstenboschensis TaxID=1245436 RepID=UPI001FB43394